MKSDKITGIFFIIVLIGIIGGVFHLFQLHIVTEKTGSILVISNPVKKEEIKNLKFEHPISRKDEGKKMKKEEIQNPKSTNIPPPPITTMSKLAWGSLLVQSNPANATVHLNGEEKGKTPLTISKLIPWQPYQLKLSLFKHDDWNTNIFVDPGEDAKIEVNLKPKLEGFIYVTSIPPLIPVYLDDELIGKTPLREFIVNAGKHTLKVMQEGSLSQTKEITILPDENIFINFELISGN